MAVITGGVIIEGGPPQELSGSAAPVDGTDEVQVLTITADEGTYKVGFNGWYTTALAWNANSAAVQAAMRLLPPINGANVTVAGDAPHTITFVAALGKEDQPLCTTNVAALYNSNPTAGTAVVTQSVAGVTATGRGAPLGTLYTRTATGVRYANTGTALAPTWVAQADTLGTSYLGGVTPGTVLANKAVIVGADKEIDTIAIAASGLKIGAGAGTAVTATAAQLNATAGVTAGTVAASKAVVVGANKNIDTIAIADGGLKLGAAAGTAVTATAVEINGATGADLTAASTAVAGGVLAIPITHPIVLKTTGGVEALSLADGAPGQILTITLAVDGGDGTLTPTTKTGFTSIVFADAGDTVSLIFRPTVGWMILGTAGVAAPPVIAIV